jgi:hypothetical protein
MLGVRKSEGTPEHKLRKIPEQIRESAREHGDKESRKSVLVSKVVSPFTRALGPPFIGRRKRDFYVLRLPSNLGNIPNVNMYMNISYIL